MADADYVLAWTDDGRRWKLDLVAIDRFSDLAVFQLPTPTTPLAFNTANDPWSGSTR